jgi:hypothetical protein
MVLGFLVIFLPLALAWVAQQLYPEKRIIDGDTAAGYFFGVVFTLVAVTIAT